jgi:F-type H+-transporting ATPase subunit a
MLHIQIGAEKLFSIGPIAITNTLLMTWIVALFLIIVTQLVARRMSLVPAFLQNIVESAVEMLLGGMEKVLGSREKAEKYFPLIATIFILVLISNWFGIIPGVGSVGFYEVVHGEREFRPLLRSAASDLNFTLAIAVISVIVTNVFGIFAQGFRGHASKFFSFKDPISFFVGMLELLGELAKMISFSFRLFGNIFAGEVLLIITGFLAPFIVPVPFLMLEVFVGFIQALVFSTLTLVFISIAIESHTEAHV